MNFKENLKKYRKQFGMSQGEIGVICGGFAAASVWKWEKGQNEPNIESLCKLADAFGVTIDELVGHVPKSEPMILEAQKKEPPADDSKEEFTFQSKVTSSDFEKLFEQCVEKILHDKGLLK